MTTESESTTTIERAGQMVMPTVSARVIGRSKARPASTSELDEDHRSRYGEQAIRPPDEPEHLVTMNDRSSIVPQCIEALKTNIEGYGHGFEPTVPMATLDDSRRSEVEAERDRARRFFETATVDFPFTELRMRTRHDIEGIGWSGWELIPIDDDDPASELIGLEHVKGINLRMTVRSKEAVTFSRMVLSPDGGEWIRRTYDKRPRLFVQITNGTSRVYFKEPGDPRRIDRKTGEVLADGAPAPNGVARELLWFGRYNPSSEYGLPRWYGAAVAVGGLRQSEEVNFLYFTHKSVPPIVVMVQGGVLNEASVQRIAHRFEELHGVENWHKALILEAVPHATGTISDLNPGAAMTPKVEIKPLTEAQHGDALFQVYEQRSRDKILSAFGLPPIFVGSSRDYTRATAQVSLEVAERGTFGPARAMVDDRVNRFIMSRLGIRWWRFRSNGPKLSSAEDVARIINAGVQSGAGSPNEYAEILGEVLGIEVSRIPYKWGDLPFKVIEMAMQAGTLAIDLDTGELVQREQVSEEQVARVRRGLAGAVADEVERQIEIRRGAPA